MGKNTPTPDEHAALPFDWVPERIRWLIGVTVTLGPVVLAGLGVEIPRLVWVLLWLGFPPLWLFVLFPYLRKWFKWKELATKILSGFAILGYCWWIWFVLAGPGAEGSLEEQIARLVADQYRITTMESQVTLTFAPEDMPDRRFYTTGRPTVRIREDSISLVEFGGQISPTVVWPSPEGQFEPLFELPMFGPFTTDVLNRPMSYFDDAEDVVLSWDILRNPANSPQESATSTRETYTFFRSINRIRVEILVNGAVVIEEYLDGPSSELPRIEEVLFSGHLDIDISTPLPTGFDMAERYDSRIRN